MDPRLSHQGLKILSVFIARPIGELSGADLMRETHLKSGTLYPILFRFEEAGLLESHWEAGDPHELGRPRRRLYRVTAAGQRVAKQALDALVRAPWVPRPAGA
jgi:DNA-binding PadR family transcriptional regulator